MKVGIIFDGFFEDCEIHKVFDVSDKEKLNKCYEYIFKKFIEEDLITELEEALYKYEEVQEICKCCNGTGKIQKVYANETVEMTCDRCGGMDYKEHYKKEFDELNNYHKKAKSGNIKTIKELMKIYDNKAYFVIKTISVPK